MDGDSPHPMIELAPLVAALEDIEEAHRPNLSLREDMQHVPAGCSCGKRYSAGDEWVQARRHMREESALAVVRALHRPCETCLGSGVWHKLRAESICPDCEGTGRLMTPLPPMMFRDHDGVMWWVELSNQFRTDASPAWVHRHV